MRRNILHSICSPQPQSTQVETQDFASHKQPFRKPTLNYILHISMLLFLGRRKILRLYKARAINIKYY